MCALWVVFFLPDNLIASSLPCTPSPMPLTYVQAHQKTEKIKFSKVLKSGKLIFTSVDRVLFSLGKKTTIVALFCLLLCKLIYLVAPRRGMLPLLVFLRVYYSDFCLINFYELITYTAVCLVLPACGRNYSIWFLKCLKTKSLNLMDSVYGV